jgi:hypothetical protein
MGKYTKEAGNEHHEELGGNSKPRVAMGPTIKGFGLALSATPNLT